MRTPIMVHFHQKNASLSGSRVLPAISQTLATYSDRVPMYAMTSFIACSVGNVMENGRIFAPVTSSAWVPRNPALKFWS